MPSRTERLTALLPEVYAARWGDGTLLRVLDAVGAQLTAVDADLKHLLATHWVDHATGPALDGLAATLGERRRTSSDGTQETDAQLRRRLRSVVRLYTGGGTVAAVKGAVRAALGLPFSLDSLGLPPGSPLLAAVDALVDLQEFAPERTVVRTRSTDGRVDGDGYRLDLVVDLASVRPDRPTVAIRSVLGIARNLSVELQTADGVVGVRADTALALHPDESLVLETDTVGRFLARVSGAQGPRSVTHLWTALDGTPPALPEVPVGSSSWVFRAGSGLAPDRPPRGRVPYGSSFDEDTFDLPELDVTLEWTRYEPLTFDVVVPYFLADAVARLEGEFAFPTPIIVFTGLPPGRIQEVVDDTRAAGVRARVSFSLALPQEGADVHDVEETVTAGVRARVREDAGPAEALTVGSVSSLRVTHDQDAALRILGIHDVSTFDDEHQGFAG